VSYGLVKDQKARETADGQKLRLDLPLTASSTRIRPSLHENKGPFLRLPSLPL